MQFSNSERQSLTGASPPQVQKYKVASLDFERVINHHSIQNIRKRFQSELPPKGDTENGVHSLAAFTPKTKERSWLLGFTGRTATRWVLTIVASLLTCLTSIGLVICTSQMVSWRSSILHSLVLDWEHSVQNKFQVFQTYLLTNLSLALLSSMLCVCFVPHAAGSGIPEVKAYLNGVRSMHKLASVPLFVVKVVGTILSVSSGLSVGQEGPLIHIGAIMGASCTKIGGSLQNLLEHWITRCRSCRDRQPHSHSSEPSFSERLLSWTMQELAHFATDAERRDLVSIGASVGFAASFGAPIGGLLFILDDISCYFERSLLLRMLIGNAVGTFCLALKHENFADLGIINLGHFRPEEIFKAHLAETPLYILIGLGGGVLGGVFCAGYLWLRRNITSRFPPPGKGRGKYQLLEIAVVSVLTSAVLFFVPHLSWACKTTASNEMQADKRFFCKQGEINEMATAMLGSRISAIKDILADPSAYQQKTLVTMGGVFYILTLITFGTCMPSGLFTPTILVGATLGGACGNIFAQFIDENIAPSTYALLGVASMLAGIQRSTVSVAVILVEGTGTMKVLLPTIIVVAISRYVAQTIHPLGIFEAAIAFKKLPYLEHEEIPRYYDAVSVADILTDSPFCLKSNEKVQDLADALNTTTYDSFPVVDEDQQFLGLVKIQQVAALLESGIFTKDKITASNENFEAEIAADEHLPLFYWAYCISDDRYGHIIQLPEEEVEQVAFTYNSMQNHDFTKSVRMAIRRQSSSQSYHPPEEVSFCQIGRNESGCIIVSSVDFHHREYWVDIGSVANKGTYTVSPFCPVSKAYHLFTSLGLSHIVVLDRGAILGVLSRNNFLPKHIEERSGL